MSKFSMVYEKDGEYIKVTPNGSHIKAINCCLAVGHKITFKCHNATILSNAYGDRVIIQEVKR